MSRGDLFRAAGFAAVGLLIGTAYVYSGWMRRPVLVLGPVAAIWLLAGFGYGVRRSRRTTPVRRSASGLAWTAVVLFAVATPGVARLLELRWKVAEIPLVEREPAILLIETDFIRFNGTGDYRVYYQTHVPFKAVCRFYEKQVPARGWRPGIWESQPSVPELRPHYGRMRWCDFRRGGERMHVHISEILTGHGGNAAVSIAPSHDADGAPAILPRF